MSDSAAQDPVVLALLPDDASLRETTHLLRSPANARRLLEAIDRLEAVRPDPDGVVRARWIP